MKTTFILLFLSISTVFSQVDCAHITRDFSGKCDAYNTYSGVRSTYSYKKGELHGKFEEIYKDGQQRALGTYKKGLLHGKFSSFYSSGEEMTLAKFKSGSGDFEMTHKNGETKVLGQFESGRATGTWKFFNENGELTREMDVNNQGLEMFSFLVGDQQVRNKKPFGNFFEPFGESGFSFSFGGNGDSTYAQMRREMNESMKRMQMQMERMFEGFNDTAFMQSFQFDTTFTFNGSDGMNGFFEFKSFGDSSFSKSFHFDTVFGDLPQRSNPYFNSRDKDLVDFPDVEPDFIGGENAMKAYIEAELHNSEVELPEGSGTVFIEAIIEKDGSISNARVALGVEESFDKEALRIVKNMPNWKPAISEGREVRSRCIVPVSFN